MPGADLQGTAPAANPGRSASAVPKGFGRGASMSAAGGRGRGRGASQAPARPAAAAPMTEVRGHQVSLHAPLVQEVCMHLRSRRPIVQGVLRCSAMCHAALACTLEAPARSGCLCRELLPACMHAASAEQLSVMRSRGSMSVQRTFSAHCSNGGQLSAGRWLEHVALAVAQGAASSAAAGGGRSKFAGAGAHGRGAGRPAVGGGGRGGGVPHAPTRMGATATAATHALVRTAAARSGAMLALPCRAPQSSVAERPCMHACT
jgi:hypothetical protein